MSSLSRWWPTVGANQITVAYVCRAITGCRPSVTAGVRPASPTAPTNLDRSRAETAKAASKQRGKQRSCHKGLLVGNGFRHSQILIPSPSFQKVCDTVRAGGGVLMLPNTDNYPPGIHQSSVRIKVSSTVGFDLLFPEFGILCGGPIVLGTSVPEASIHEHGHTVTGKDNVSTPFEVGERTGVDPIAEGTLVKQLAQRHFRRGVLAAVRPHNRACTDRRGL